MVIIVIALRFSLNRFIDIGPLLAGAEHQFAVGDSIEASGDNLTRGWARGAAG